MGYSAWGHKELDMTEHSEGKGESHNKHSCFGMVISETL